MASRLSGPSYLPDNHRELLFWLGLVLLGAFVGRVFVVHAHRLTHR